MQRNVAVPVVTSVPSCAKAHTPLSAGGDELVGATVEVGALLARLDVTADGEDGLGPDVAEVVVTGVSWPTLSMTSRTR